MKKTNNTALDIVNPSAILVPTQVDQWLDELSGRIKNVAGVSRKFLDVCSTSMGRASAYNSRKEQEEMTLEVHKALLSEDRGLYTLLCLLEGNTDYSKQTALKILLEETPSIKDDNLLLSNEEESKVLSVILRSLPSQRLFKLFASFSKSGKKINNSRTRKLIFRTLLQAPVSKMEFWAVKYRTKFAAAIKHALGERRTSIVCSLISKSTVVEELFEREQRILNDFILKYMKGENPNVIQNKLEIIGFLFGVEKNLKLPKLKAYSRVKAGDWDAVKELPLEVVEGLRSTYFKDKTKKDVLSATKDNLTKGQKMAVQKKSKEAGVEVEFEPVNYDPVRLYLYAYEMGITTEIKEALQEKAKKIAKNLPIKFEKIGILLDSSASMFGSKEQALRPMAVSLAMRDVLQAASDESVVYTTTDGLSGAFLPRPSGDTSLAIGLVELLEQEVQAIFVLSDGYENTSAGRFAQTMKVIRELGIETPVFQISPVSANESSGVKELASGLVESLPIQNPTALGTTMLKALLAVEPKQGLRYLVALSLKSLPNSIKNIENKEE